MLRATNDDNPTLKLVFFIYGSGTMRTIILFSFIFVLWLFLFLSLKVNAADSAQVTITSINPGSVIAGNSITIIFSIKNTGTKFQSFGVGGEIWEG